MIIDMTTKTVRFIILFLSAFFATVGAYAQNIPVVHGKIVDENGEPLPAATVVVKGTKKIAIADLQGAFELQDVPLSSVLEVAFLGCETKEVAPTSRKMEIVLSAAKDILDDAVVIGYGTARKRDLTGSVVSLRGDELIEKTPVDVYDILQGQVAGVQINSNSGAPGEGATVRIRGIATFGEGANPLYVVDDLPVDNIDSVNPEDISSIEVLKDAASAAIYGSRSANGVILITTKKGVPGKPKVDVRYSHAFNNVSHLMPLTTPDDFRYYEDVRYGLTGISNFWREDENRPFYNYDGNLYRDILRTAHKDEVNLSASGASDRLQYFLSGGYYGEQGVIINSDYKRVTARMNVSYKANENFTFGSNAQFQFSDRMGCNENNIISDIYQWVPYWNIKLADGSPMPSIAGKTSAYIRCLDQREEQKKINASGMIFAEFRFAEFFKIRANLSGSMDLLRINYFQPTTLVNSSTGHSKGFDKTKLTYFWLNEDYISYDRTINSHSFSVMAGMSFTTYNLEEAKVCGLDYSTNYIWTVNAATQFLAGPDNNYSLKNQHSMASFFGRVTYNWKSRYLFAGNIRYDGSSRFSKNSRWGVFPSASIGWRFSDEPFLSWMRPVVSDGKLRASYGVTGNENIGDYESWAKYESSGVYNGVGGLYPTLAYADLSWEQTSQLDLGLDLSLFNGRVNLVADWYDKNTSDLLYKVEVPKETGFKTMTKNVGGVNNTGFEISLDAKIIDKKDVKLKANFNISRNVSVATRLADDVPFFVGNQSCIYMQTDHRLGEFYGLTHDGVFAYDQSNAFDTEWNRLTPVFEDDAFSHYLRNGEIYTGEVLQKSYNGKVLGAGDINWEEVRKDGVIDAGDYRVLGCAQPEVYGGFGASFSWKWLSLSLAFTYSIGGEIYNYTSMNRNSFKTTFTAPDAEHIYNMWTKPGDVAKYPTPDYQHTQNQACLVSDYWIEDGSFVRLNNAKLMFTMPYQVRKKLRVRDLKFNIYGKNLLTWTNYSGNDPEFGGSVLAFGIDTGRYPRKREIGVGVTLGF